MKDEAIGPIELTDDELDHVAGGAIVLVNPAGNEPQGDAQGRAIEAQNPAGHAPPGQNK